MKTIPVFGTRGLILILGAALGVGFSAPAFPASARAPHTAVIVNPDGKVMYLGTLGGQSSEASGINDSGQVVGSSATGGFVGGFHAFITGPNGRGMIDLGTLGGRNSYALDINDAGQVVGYSEDNETVDDPPWHAFITGPNGMGMTDLGTLGGSSSIATGINDSGQVVGTSIQILGMPS